MLIQGVTLAGVLLDEVALMPRSLWSRRWPGVLYRAPALVQLQPGESPALVQ